MSVSHPDRLATKQDLKDFYNEIYPYFGGVVAASGFTPVGTIIAVMGNTAPDNYVACNGQVVNITTYPDLASYFGEQFGAINYFGGDGTTTFGIPDLRGEFLRGTGTNGHATDGNGAAVGTHQKGTFVPGMWHETNSTLYIGSSDSFDSVNNSYILGDIDKQLTPQDLGGSIRRSFRISGSTTNDAQPTWVFGSRVRPTNTSVLYCIAVKNIYIGNANDYSTSEKVVGTWVDGSQLYQITVSGNYPTDSNEYHLIDTGIQNVERVVDAKGLIDYENNNTNQFIPLTTLHFSSSTSPTLANAEGIWLSTMVTNDSDKALKIYLQNKGWTVSVLKKYHVTIQYTKSS